ncbi:MAG: exodeoxyribonuclease V subunit gamma [bacterium]
MLHLTCSNQMEALVGPLAREVQAARAADPLGAIDLIVPDQSVAQYLRFRLAERLGIAAHLRFSFLTRFLKAQVEAVDPTLRVVDCDRLQLLVFARLCDPTLTRIDGLERVQRYLERGTTEAERQTRALQLALQLGRLFEEYGYSRREMLRAWRRGPCLRHPAYARTERWQQILWRQLFDDDGALRVSLPTPMVDQAGQLGLFGAAPTVRHMLLADAVAAASRQGLRLPGPIHVFGLSYVAPAFAEIFARLARTGPLHVYAVNPCMEFWEDVEQADESLRRAAQGRLVHRGDKLDAFELDASQSVVSLEDFGDPFDLDRPGDTPALRRWGRPGREYVRLLNQLTDCRFEAHFRDPTRGRPPTLLSRLQQDILVRAPERAVATEGEPDASIRLLACPGIRREVEIVADHIWALVRERDAAGEPLRFHQIAVMVADPRREDYLTHLDAVFRERHGLPFNVIDRPLSGQSRVIEAIERLLDLPGTQFEYAELMRLLTHPAVGGADPDVDVGRWRRWGDALKIVFGADRADLEDTYIDRDVFNWDQALRRLLLGAFVTGERAGDRAPVELAAGVWMPYETGPDALPDVGRLVSLARCLIADARALRTAELSVADWCVLLARLDHPVHLGGARRRRGGRLALPGRPGAARGHRSGGADHRLRGGPGAGARAADRAGGRPGSAPGGRRGGLVAPAHARRAVRGRLRAGTGRGALPSPRPQPPPRPAPGPAHAGGRDPRRARPLPLPGDAPGGPAAPLLVVGGPRAHHRGSRRAVGGREGAAVPAARVRAPRPAGRPGGGAPGQRLRPDLLP